MSRPPQHRSLCFTINRQEEEEHELLLLDLSVFPPESVRYCIYQREMGTHEHFQGYIEFTRQFTMEQVHAFEGFERSALFPRRGTAQQASHYASKPHDRCVCQHCVAERAVPTKLEGPWIYGEMSAQGQRADLITIKRQIDAGVSSKRIAEDESLFPTWIKFPKQFEHYRRIITTPRATKPTVFLFIGPSGTGKTRTAMTLASYLGTVYKVPPKSTGFWCDDYANETVFLIDEMTGSKMTPEFFNELLDWYPMNVPAHGTAGHIFNSPFVFICTNYHPSSWWKHRTPDQVKMTMRRIDIVIKMLNKVAPKQPCPYCARGLCAFHHK